MNIKHGLNRVRHNYGFSAVARRVFRPIQRLCSQAANQIERKIWISGGAVTYDDIVLEFPRGVGSEIASAVFWRGTYENETWKALKPLLLDAGRFVDVGSNIGIFAVLAKKLNPELLVDAFEPVPSICEKNRAFHLANGIADHRIYNLALADFEGEAKLLLPQEPESVEEASAGTLRQDSWQRRKQYTREVPVEVTTLDAFLSERSVKKPLVLKVDVEDFEAAVLRGAAETIRRWRPRIVCEILPRKHGNKETLAVLRDCSYAVFALTKQGLFRVRKDDFTEDRSFIEFLLIDSEEVSARRNFIPYGELADLRPA